MPKDARDILQDTIFLSLCFDKRGKYEKPGSFVEGLPKEKRDVLKTLTSDEAANTRNVLLK